MTIGLYSFDRCFKQRVRDKLQGEASSSPLPSPETQAVAVEPWTPQTAAAV